MKKYIFIHAVIFSLLFTLLLSGCSSSKNTEPVSKSGFYFNTVITVTIYDSSKADLLDECFQLADTYEHYFSNTISDSDVSLINAADGQPIEVHDETIDLLQKGIYYGELSNGKFDITIGTLSDLWDISTKALLEDTDASMIPSEEEIANALATVDYRGVQIDGNNVTLTVPGSRLDLGGIAKGYIADRMKEFLNQNGVTSGIINLGGNVLTLGEKSDNSNYRIGIQRPFSSDGTSIAAIEISDASVVSSGVYERYFEVDGVSYHHILDTATGYPYDNGLLGVTIISSDSVDGDALSTTCFSLGLTDGMALIESLPDTEAVFITDDYELHNSSGIGTTVPLYLTE
jgi:thiamine biosynthesis lipoprotein